MKQMPVSLVIGLLMMLGCRTIPGRDVRYEPTPIPVVRAMLELAAVAPQNVVYDLGSGDGGVPITAAKEFGARGVGIELDPALVARAQANAREESVEDNVEFRLGDMYAADVRPATVVILFLHPKPNLKLRLKLRSDLRPGSRVVSYMWDMGDWTPDEVRRVGRRRVFLWRIPTRAPGTVEGNMIHRLGRSVRARQVDNRQRVAGIVRQIGAPDVRAAVVGDEHQRPCGRGLMRQIPDFEFARGLALQADDLQHARRLARDGNPAGWLAGLLSRRCRLVQGQGRGTHQDAEGRTPANHEGECHELLLSATDACIDW